MKRLFLFTLIGAFVMAFSAVYAAEKAPVLGDGHVAVKVGHISFTDDYAKEYDHDKATYVGLEGFVRITPNLPNLYLGMEIGYANPDGGYLGWKNPYKVNYPGDPVAHYHSELTFVPVELNLKYAIEAAPNFTFAFGAGPSYNYAKLEGYKVDVGPPSVNFSEHDWLLGGQVFADVNYKWNQFFAGINGKYQVTEEFGDEDENLNNWRIGVQVGFYWGKEKVAEALPRREAEVVVVKNSDCDNVPDDLDKCPDTPCGCNVDKDGCPIDSDKDGVCDGLDKCPGTPVGCKVDKDGCPIDSDKDGVCDGLDKCPDTPEGAKVDKDGCPIWVSMRLKVEFDFNKAIVKPQYYDEIKKVADFMTAYPNLKTTIEGHTDNRGTAKYNLGLSRRRANAVKEVLVKEFKIAPERLTTAGYGFTRPIADNSTEAGRQENRRTQAVMKAMELKK